MSRHETTRRDFLQRTFIAVATACAFSRATAAAPAKRPNILFILTDDQRYDALGAFGNTHIHTPHMDRLAAEGTHFRHAHIVGGSVPAVCMPSRAMTMTGRGLYELHDDGRSIPEDHILLPEHLRAHGYATFGTGKWHNGQDAFRRGFTHGDNVFFGGMHDHFNTPVKKLDGKKFVDVPSEGVHSSDLFSEACCRFIDYNAGTQPFFAYVSFTAPHDPRTTHKRYHDMYDPATLPLPPNYLPRHPFDNGEYGIRDEKLAPWPRTPDIVRKHLADYYAMITHMDDAIGRILATLEASGQRDNTIVVLAGDNGLAVGSHGLMGKQNLYDHSVRVPLIMRGPGVAVGPPSDALVCINDIYPTLCELLGVGTPASVTCPSFVGCFLMAKALTATTSTSYANVQRALTDGRHKLIEYAVPQGEKIVRHTQLFDLLQDPAERYDLHQDPASQSTLDRLYEALRAARDTQKDHGAFWSSWDQSV